MGDLAKYVRGYRLKAVLSPILVTGEVAMEVIIPFLMGNIVNSGLQGGNSEYVRTESLLLVMCAVASLVFGVSAGYCAADAGAGFAKNLRVAIFRRLQLFSFGNIGNFSQGGIVTRLTGDVFFVQNSFQMIIRIAVRLPMMLAFALIMAVRISGEIAVIYAVAIPFLAVVLTLIARTAMPIFTKAFDEIDALNNFTQESLHAVRVVKSFTREETEKARFEKVIARLYEKLVRAETLIALNGPILRAVVYACIIVIAKFGSRYIVAGKMLPGNLMALFIYNFQMFFSMMMFAMIISMIIMSRSCYRRIRQVLGERLDVTDPENPVTEIADGSIEFRNVDFSYQKDPAKLSLKGINLSIRSGETIGVVGETGSGKSSLVNLIARLYDVTSGAVLVGGKDVRSYSLRTLRDGVSVVLQKNNLFSGTIRSSLKWGNAKAGDNEIYRALATAQIADFVNSNSDGLDYPVEQQGRNFSGGQRQRLCIARALLKNPKILVMDDSSSALDTATDARLRASLKADRPDLTRIIIAHKVLSVMDCDRIVVMDGGSVAAVGTHSELMASSRFYADLCSAQLRNGEGEARHE